MKTKKVVAGLMGLVLGMSLTACQGGTTGPTSAGGASASGAAAGGAKGEVTMWMYPVISDETKSQSFWKEQEQKFEAANPGVDLKIELQPWANRDEKLATAMAAGNGPDLVYMIPDQLGQYVANGGIVPVDGMLAEKDKLFEPAVKAASVNGKVYGLPILQSPTTTAYNKAMFDEAGIKDLPKTWDDIKAAAPKLAEKGHPVMAYYGGDTLNLSFYPLLWQAGGRIFTEDGKGVAFNSPEGVEALQFLVDLQKVGGIPKDAAIAKNLAPSDFLVNKGAAMAFMFEDARMPDAKKALGDSLVLGTPLKGKQQVTYGAVGMLARTKIRKNDDAIKAAYKFFGTADFSKGLNTAGRRLPARTDVTIEGIDPVFNEALKVLNAGEPNQYARQMQGVLSPHIQAALQGKETPKQALDAAAEEAKSLMR